MNFKRNHPDVAEIGEMMLTTGRYKDAPSECRCGPGC